MMEDPEALNRRTNLPMRILQDRPQQQKEELLCEETQEEEKEPNLYEEVIETHIVKNYTCENTQEKITRTNQKKKLAEQENCRNNLSKSTKMHKRMKTRRGKQEENRHPKCPQKNRGRQQTKM